MISTYKPHQRDRPDGEGSKGWYVRRFFFQPSDDKHAHQ